MIGERTATLVSGLLALSSLMCFVGAVVVRQTGEQVVLANGYTFRTHQDAFLVLLVVAIVLLVNTAVVAAQIQPRER